MKLFHSRSTDMFQDDGAGNLWVTSALRFFLLEDYMIDYNIAEIMHIEGMYVLYLYGTYMFVCHAVMSPNYTTDIFSYFKSYSHFYFYHLLHNTADNMLYGSFTEIINIFRNGYSNAESLCSYTSADLCF